MSRITRAEARARGGGEGIHHLSRERKESKRTDSVEINFISKHRMKTFAACTVGAAARFGLFIPVLGLLYVVALKVDLRVALHAQSRYVQHRWVAGSEITTRGLQTAFASLTEQGGHQVGSSGADGIRESRVVGLREERGLSADATSRTPLTVT